MLLEKTFDIIFFFVMKLLALLPNVDIGFDSAVFNNLAEVFRMAGYLLPMSTVKTIVFLVIQLQLLTISFALIRTIWKFIPVFGG